MTRIVKHKALTQRKKDAMKTRKQIYNVALKLYASHGFDFVTIDQIAKAAKVSRGTFYTYFTSKDDVLVEYYKNIDNQYNEMVPILNQELTAFDRLQAFYRMVFELVHDRMGFNFIRALYINQISSNRTINFIGNRSRPIYCILMDIVAFGKSTGEFRNDIEDNLLVENLVRALRSLIYDWCLRDGNFDLVKESQLLSSFLFKGLLRR